MFIDNGCAFILNDWSVEYDPPAMGTIRAVAAEIQRPKSVVTDLYREWRLGVVSGRLDFEATRASRHEADGRGAG